MEPNIDLVINVYNNNASAVCRWYVCFILCSKTCLRRMPALERRDIMQPPRSACSACRWSNLRCEARALGEEIPHASWSVRGVFREMR